MQTYPTLPGLTFPVLRMAEFDTMVQSAPNKHEVRIPQTVNPVWHWELIYDFLRDFLAGVFTVTELRTLVDFFLYQGGQAGEFLFLDPDDNYVGPATSGYTSTTVVISTSPRETGVLLTPTPNLAAQLPLVTDGAGHFYSPLQRSLGGLFFEDVTDLNTDLAAGGSALAVCANGDAATNYTLQGPGLAVAGSSYMGLYLEWTAEPTPPITAQFNFYFRVRFESDSMDMEKFANQFWTIGGSESRNGSGYVKLCTARPQPL